MKRSFEQDADVDDKPPCKRQHQIAHYAKDEIDNNSFLNNPKLCDVTFRVPIARSITTVDDNDRKEENDEMQDIDVNTNDYVEYLGIKMFFAMHSQYFETILYKNEKVDINMKITLDDLNCNTFEFIRDWCYPNKNAILNKNNVLNVLISSFKYEINTLFKQCIEYIRNNWIVNGESLVEFVQAVSNHNNSKLHKKPALIHNLPLIFNNNKILQEFSLKLSQSMTKDWNVDVLKCIIESDSFYLREDLIWRMCAKFCELYSGMCGFFCQHCECTRMIEDSRICPNCNNIACSKCLEYLSSNYECKSTRCVPTKSEDTTYTCHVCNICADDIYHQDNNGENGICAYCHNAMGKLEGKKCVDGKTEHKWEKRKELELGLFLGDNCGELDHPCTKTETEIRGFCSFCCRNQGEVNFFSKCIKLKNVGKIQMCGDENCLEIGRLKMRIIESTMKQLIPVIRLHNFSFDFFMKNVKNTLQHLDIVSDSKILDILTLLYDKKKENNNSKDERYQFDNNVCHLTQYNRSRLNYKVWMVIKDDLASEPIESIDGYTCVNFSCNKIEIFGNSIASLKDVIAIKNNFTSGVSFSKLDIHEGKCMEAKQWIFNQENSDQYNNYQASVDEKNPWQRVQVIKYESPLLCVELQTDNNKCQWWLFDENYKMLRNCQ